MDPKRKELNKSVASIVLPLALQSMLGMLVNLADTVMVGRLGSIALAGVSQANQVFFIVAMTIPGIAAGAGVLLSQAWGRRDLAQMDKVMALAAWTSMVFAILVTAASVLVPLRILYIYTNDPATAESGAIYLRIVAWSYLFYTATTVVTGCLRCIRSVRICLYAAIVSLVLNIGGNYLLIEGHLGAPSLGVRGAALATLAARIGEFIVIAVYVRWFEKKVEIRLAKLLQLDLTLAPLFLKTAIPVIINEMFWGFGVSAQAVVVGRLGSDVVAANAVSGSVTQLATVICQGSSAACCVITGNNIGAKNLTIIPHLKKYFQHLALILGSAASMIVLLLIPLAPSIYHLSGSVLPIARSLMLVNAFIIPFMQLQSMNMMGLLRGAGDVHFQMANDLIFLWGVTVPLGFLAGLVLHLPVPAVYLCLKCDQVIKVFTSEWRIRRCAWIHDMSQKDALSGGKAMRMEEIV